MALHSQRGRIQSIDEGGSSGSHSYAQFNTTPPMSSGKGVEGCKEASRSLAPRDDEDRWERAMQIAMRALHVLCHLALCIVALYVMLVFLATPTLQSVPSRNRASREAADSLSRNEAFALVTTLVLDVLLDLYGLWMCRYDTSGWVLATRLVTGTCHIVMFVVYYALGGQVFPPQFTVLGLRRGFAGPLVYGFMWMLGTWDVLWVITYRHQLKKIRHWNSDGKAISGDFKSEGYRERDVERNRPGVTPPPGYLDSVRLSEWRGDKVDFQVELNSSRIN